MDAGVRSVALGAAAALTVVAAYAFGSGQASATDDVTAQLPPVTTGEAGDARTLAMHGTGERTGVPDQLSFRLSVRAEGSDVTTALGDASSTMRRVLSALGGAEVRREDVQTTGLSVRPEYDYSSTGPPALTGYVATQSVSVLVRELREAGTAIATATTAGGNAVRVSGVRLRIGDRDELLADARDAAVAEARAKAEQYATATGHELGDVQSLREVRARGGAPVALDYRGAVLDAAASPPIRAGSRQLTVTVAVVWALE